MSYSPYRQYVIDGAELKCSFQSSGSMHNGLPLATLQGEIKIKALDNKSVFIQNKLVCTEKDDVMTGCYSCIAKGNKCTPAIKSEWNNPRGRAANVITQENHYLLLDDAVIKCIYGGILSFVNSGQTSTSFISAAGRITLPREARTYISFPLRHPAAALNIGQYKRGSTNISTIAVLFANGIGLKENTKKEGSQVNAFRHTFWQAVIANEYGSDVAKEAGNAHEENVLALQQIADTQKSHLVISRLLNSAEADEVVDLRNNIIGRDIGQKNADANNDELAKDILLYYRDYGLYEATQYNDSEFFMIEKKRINNDDYINAVESIDKGLDPNDRGRQNKRG